MKREMNQITISVKFSGKNGDIGSLSIREESFRYVPREDLNHWYKLDTGFCISFDDTKII